MRGRNLNTSGPEQTEMSTTVEVQRDRLLTPEQAADLLGVTCGTLSVWRCTRRYPGLKYTKVGTRIRYRQSDIEAWLRSRTVGGEQD